MDFCRIDIPTWGYFARIMILASNRGCSIDICIFFFFKIPSFLFSLIVVVKLVGAEVKGVEVGDPEQQARDAEDQHGVPDSIRVSSVHLSKQAALRSWSGGDRKERPVRHHVERSDPKLGGEPVLLPAVFFPGSRAADEVEDCT